MTRPRNDAGQVRQNRSGSWSVIFTNPDGKRVSAGSHPTKKAATAALRDILSDLANDRWFDEAKGKKTAFGDFARRAVAQWDIAPSTRKNYLTILRTTLAQFERTPLASISIETVDRWWTRHADHLVNRRNSYFVLRKVLRYAVRWRYIRENPAMIEDAGEDVARPRPTFSGADLIAVVEHLPEDLRAPVLVAYGAHLRVGELCGLNVGDYDPKTEQLTVRRQADPNGNLVPTKTGNVKTVRPLGVGLDALKSHLATRSAIGAAAMFPGARGGRITRQHLRTHWVIATAAAGVPEMHLHDLRHVGLTAVARAGAPLRLIQNRGGHTSVAAAMRYQHVDADLDREIATAVDRMTGASGSA